MHSKCLPFCLAECLKLSSMPCWFPWSHTLKQYVVNGCWHMSSTWFGVWMTSGWDTQEPWTLQPALMSIYWSVTAVAIVSCSMTVLCCTKALCVSVHAQIKLICAGLNAVKVALHVSSIVFSVVYDSSYIQKPERPAALCADHPV